MKKLFSWIIVFCVFLALALVALFTVFYYQSSATDTNVSDSVGILQSEGLYPSYGFSFRPIVLDNYTDALMLNTAYSAADSSMKFALTNPRFVLTPEESNQILNLQAGVNKTALGTSTYERYWHGYVVFVRPLLLVTSYAGIRVLLTIALFMLIAALLFALLRQKKNVKAAALVAAVLYTDALYVGQSIQLSQVYLIGAAVSLFIVQQKKPQVSVTLLFFSTGMLTAFFDLLTAPLVTLGFLIVVATEQEDIRKLIQRSFSWAVGYGAFWVSKWIIVATLVYPEAISNALGHVLNRTVTEADQNFTYIQTLYINIRQLIGYEKISLGITAVLGATLILGLLAFRKKRIPYQKVLYWLLVFAMPYGWYLFAANHSYIHVWFTYRAQFVSVAAGVIAYSYCIDLPKMFNLIRLITAKSSRY